MESLRLEEAAICRRGRLGTTERLTVSGGDGQTLFNLQERRRELGELQALAGRTEPLTILPVSIEHHLRSSPWERRLLFPLCFILLLILTVTALLLVASNCVYLTFDPASTPRAVQDYLLGRESTSTLGPLGALAEVVVIMYPPTRPLHCLSLPEVVDL